MILSPEQDMIQDMARKFAGEKIAGQAAAWEAAGAYPKDLFTDMGKLGFFAMTIEPAYGGAKTDYVSYALALIEIAAGDGGLSTVMSVHNSLAALIIQNLGTEAQKKKYLPAMASGACIGAFALTEPQAGSDAAAIRTRAVRKGDVYVLNGAKQFITSGQSGGLVIVFAQTDPEAGKRGLSAFIVETDTPGYIVTKVEDKLGQKASDTCALSFEDMEVPVENLIGEEGQGYKIALSNLETGRIGIAAQCIGMARAALDCALDYARERQSFGQPIIQHQAVGFRLADMATRLEAARQLVLHAAALKEAGVPCLKQACMAKLFASEMAEAVCSDALQTLGGYGYLRDYPVEKIYRDVRVCQIYEGTSDIQKLIIGRHL